MLRNRFQIFHTSNASEIEFRSLNPSAECGPCAISEAAANEASFSEVEISKVRQDHGKHFVGKFFEMGLKADIAVRVDSANSDMFATNLAIA